MTYVSFHCHDTTLRALPGGVLTCHYAVNIERAAERTLEEWQCPPEPVERDNTTSSFIMPKRPIITQFKAYLSYYSNKQQHYG